MRTNLPARPWLPPVSKKEKREMDQNGFTSLPSRGHVGAISEKVRSILKWTSSNQGALIPPTLGPALLLIYTMMKTRGSKRKGEGEGEGQRKGSTVPLRGTASWTKGEKAAKQISKVVTKTNELNGKIDKVTKDKMNAEVKLNELQLRLRELEQRLEELGGEGAAGKLVEEVGMTTTTTTRLEVHPRFEPAYEKLGMKKVGASYNTTALRENNSVLLPNDDAATRGMKLTNSKRTANQMGTSEYLVRVRDGPGIWTGFKKTGANQAIISADIYEYHKINGGGKGLAGFNAERSRDLKTLIAEMAEKWDEIVKITMEGKAFEIHPPRADVGISYDEMLEYIAHYLRFKDFRRLTSSRILPMTYEKFIGEEVLVYKGPHHPDFPRYKSAAYRFKVREGNETRFVS